MSTRYTWIGIVFTLLAALFGVGGPLLLRKDSKEILEAIADNNTKALDGKIKEHDGKINVILDDVKKVEKKVNEMAAGAEKASKEAEESAKQASASELFSRALAEKDLDKRIELYTTVIKKRPESGPAFNNRGNAYNKKGDYDKAIKDLVEAARLLPNNGEPYLNLGNVYKNAGDLNKAIENYTLAIDRRPDYVKPYVARCRAYKNLGGEENKGLAMADAKKGLEIAKKMDLTDMIEKFEGLIKELEGGE